MAVSMGRTIPRCVTLASKGNFEKEQMHTVKQAAEQLDSTQLRVVDCRFDEWATISRRNIIMYDCTPCEEE